LVDHPCSRPAVLLHLGHDPDNAWTMISTARGNQVPDTDEQRTWISRLHEQLNQPAPDPFDQVQ